MIAVLTLCQPGPSRADVLKDSDQLHVEDNGDSISVALEADDGGVSVVVQCQRGEDFIAFLHFADLNGGTLGHLLTMTVDGGAPFRQTGSQKDLGGGAAVFIIHPENFRAKRLSNRPFVEKLIGGTSMAISVNADGKEQTHSFPLWNVGPWLRSAASRCGRSLD